jgi:hypothetical protein
MRFLALLSVFIAAFEIGLALAQQPSRVQPLGSPSRVLSAEAGQLPIGIDADRHFGLIGPHPEPMKGDDDKMCYKLRTYFVERESPSSDITHGAGYENCQAASRFGLKRAAPITFPPSN